jgi:hypothetical protein
VLAGPVQKVLPVIGSTLAQFPLWHSCGEESLFVQIEPDSSMMMHTSSFWPTQVGAGVGTLVGYGVGSGVGIGLCADQSVNRGRENSAPSPLSARTPP